jgi:hypothetical protein
MSWSLETFVGLVAIVALMWLTVRVGDDENGLEVVRGFVYAVLPSVLIWWGIIWVVRAILCYLLLLVA